MTKANLEFVQFVNSVMSTERIPHGDAWQRASKIKPDLHTLMLALGATRARVQFFNAAQQRRFQQPAQAAGQRIEARDAFIAKVHARMDKFNVDYETAYKSCKSMFANEYGASISGTSTASNACRAASSDGSGTGSVSALPGSTEANMTGIPNANIGLKALFYLPPETTQEVFGVAYKANGNQQATVHPAKVFDGLANYYMDAKSISHDSAISYCKAQFPDLWKAVTEIAKVA
jgi:hypothetical protein